MSTNNHSNSHKTSGVFIFLIIINVFTLLISGFLSYAWYMGALDQFIDMFNDFGQQIPPITQKALALKKQLWKFSFVNLAVFSISVGYKSKMGLLCSLLFGFIQVCIVLFVMYGNIFSL